MIKSVVASRSGNGEASVNIGVFGGTFDPIHNGHLIVAEEVRNRLGLVEVLFVPTGQPWMRTDSISEAKHRVGMVRLAISGKPYFKISTIEVERAGPTYTVDTIRELKSQRDEGDELYFILSWDTLSSFPRWKDPSRLLELCHLVAVPRPGYKLPDMKKLEAELPGLSRRLFLLDKPEIDVSATEIKKRVAAGLSIGHLVPESVEKYIKMHNLYKNGGSL